MKAGTVLAALMATLAQACNICDTSSGQECPGELTYLCAEQTCDIEGDSSLQCQSGCCSDGKCNADGACALRQAWISIVVIVAVFIVGVLFFFLYQKMFCKAQLAKRAAQLEASEREESDRPA